MKHFINMCSLEKLPKKGTYTLMITVSDELEVNVGRLGVKTFLPGCYIYTGSALGKGATSLPNRLARHLKTVKKRHWHIDYLLANKNVSIEAIVIISSKEKLECKVNQFIRDQTKAKAPIPKFGASDCPNRCKSHLLYCRNKNISMKFVNSSKESLAKTALFQTKIRSLTEFPILSMTKGKDFFVRQIPF